jgi:hypothetical protein
MAVLVGSSAGGVGADLLHYGWAGNRFMIAATVFRNCLV